MRLKHKLLFIVILPFLGFSQMNSSIDIIGGMDYSYRYLSIESDEEIIGLIMDMRNENEIANYSWRAGFNYNNRLSSKIVLRTGLRFASEGYKTKVFTDLKWGSDHNGNGSVQDPTLESESRYSYNYQYLEIPIAVRWEFGKNKFKPFVEIGISPSLYTNRRVKLVTDLDKLVAYDKGDSEKFHNFHFIGFLSFGADYILNENYHLFAQPVFRYHFTKIAKSPIKEYLYNGGIEIGVRRKLN